MSQLGEDTVAKVFDAGGAAPAATGSGAATSATGSGATPPAPAAQQPLKPISPSQGGSKAPKSGAEGDPARDEQVGGVGDRIEEFKEPLIKQSFIDFITPTSEADLNKEVNGVKIGDLKFAIELTYSDDNKQKPKTTNLPSNLDKIIQELDTRMTKAVENYKDMFNRKIKEYENEKSEEISLETTRATNQQTVKIQKSSISGINKLNSTDAIFGNLFKDEEILEASVPTEKEYNDWLINKNLAQKFSDSLTKNSFLAENFYKNERIQQSFVNFLKQINLNLDQIVGTSKDGNFTTEPLSKTLFKVKVQYLIAKWFIDVLRELQKYKEGAKPAGTGAVAAMAAQVDAAAAKAAEAARQKPGAGASGGGTGGAGVGGQKPGSSTDPAAAAKVRPLNLPEVNQQKPTTAPIPQPEQQQQVAQISDGLLGALANINIDDYEKFLGINGDETEKNSLAEQIFELSIPSSPRSFKNSVTIAIKDFTVNELENKMLALENKLKSRIEEYTGNLSNKITDSTQKEQLKIIFDRVIFNRDFNIDISSKIDFSEKPNKYIEDITNSYKPELQRNESDKTKIRDFLKIANILRNNFEQLTESNKRDVIKELSKVALAYQATRAILINLMVRYLVKSRFNQPGNITPKQIESLFQTITAEEGKEPLNLMVYLNKDVIEKIQKEISSSTEGQGGQG